MIQFLIHHHQAARAKEEVVVVDESAMMVKSVQVMKVVEKAALLAKDKMGTEVASVNGTRRRKIRRKKANRTANPVEPRRRSRRIRPRELTCCRQSRRVRL